MEEAKTFIPFVHSQSNFKVESVKWFETRLKEQSICYGRVRLRQISLDTIP